MTASEIQPYCPYLCKGDDGKIILNKRHSYWAQVQVNMAILNVSYCDFIVFCSYDKSFVVVPVEFDYVNCKALLLKLKNIFCEKMIHVICEKNEYK